MIPMILSDGGYNVPPNTDSPYLLIIAIAAGIAVSVLLERLSRKKRRERPEDEDDAENAPDTDENEE